MFTCATNCPGAMFSLTVPSYCAWENFGNSSLSSSTSISMIAVDLLVGLPPAGKSLKLYNVRVKNWVNDAIQR